MKALSILCLLCILFFHPDTITGQESIKDTLFNKNYEELDTLFYEWFPRDTVIAKTIADAYIEKGRAEKDSIRMAKGWYYFYAFNFGPEKGLQYADTIIALTENCNDEYYPTTGYLLKAHWYYVIDDYMEATKYYLISYKYALARDQIKHLAYIRPKMAALKNRTGDHEGALVIAREHLNTLENDPEYKELYSLHSRQGDMYISDYMTALHNLALSYLHVQEVDSAKMYVRRGIEESLKYGDTLKYYELVSTGGTAEYYAGNYRAALDSLDKALPHLIDEHNIAMAYYYKGESYRTLEEHNEALSMFLTSDSIAGKINYKFPELRQAYEYLVYHYRKEQQADSQLVYINKMLELDEELLEIRSLDGEISKEYDTPRLLGQKEELIDKLEQKDLRNRRYKLLLLGVVMFLGGCLIYYYGREQVYRKRYRHLVLDGNKRSGFSSEEIYAGAKEEPGIPQEAFHQIETGLIKFEKENKFTNPNVTLYSLARELNTNSTYLSKVINTSRGVNFSSYLHGLRIGHMVSRLKDEGKLRTYSVHALAEEAGYKTSQSFANAFYKQTGIYPSYFIKRLNDSGNNSSV